MNIINYTVDEHVAILTLNDGENKFNYTFLKTYLEKLDSIEKETNATTLLVRSSHKKIFSTGIDLKWITTIIEKKNITKAKKFFYLLNELFKRIITYPLITIASIGGHAFAAGAIMCCAFDFRLMRSDRGFFCFPEIDLGIPFLPGMNELLKKAMPIHMVEYMELTGARLTAKECEKNSIIHKSYHNNELLQESIKFAKKIKKRRPIIKEIKKRLNQQIIKTLDIDDIKYIESGKFNITKETNYI